VAADEFPQRLRPGQDDVQGGHGPECPTPVCEPGGGGEARPRGATAVAAGMGDVGCLPTGRARQERPAHGRRAAVGQIGQGAARAGQEVLAAPVPIVRPRAPQDVRHRGPARLRRA